MNLFNNKYRISSARLQTWNYANEGLYFVTICTAGKEYFFGNIIDGEMYLSEIGEFAKKVWLQIPQLRKDMNLELMEYVVMPNHIHGVISIGENSFNTNTLCGEMYQNEFVPQSKNLSSILRGYKSSVTAYACKQEISFAWQARFYDRIIRSTDEYQRIANYIICNISNWKEDSLFNK